MDGAQALLLVWAWERMPYIAPIRADVFAFEVPLARRWRNWSRLDGYWVKLRELLGAYWMTCLQTGGSSQEAIWSTTDNPTNNVGGGKSLSEVGGHQDHDWRDKNKNWVNMWERNRGEFIISGDDVIDYSPEHNYWQW
ncbi:hypothetical protein PIB30_040354 [Stylosanthes scabra]|uniref:Aminotransferase-like plant mobile domain-containing protein n=1 Tax=Stylosanthes scabra TaxID=79078 RepID=A0ABU6VE69_9FABA|nr:hypothetical protein [Stylosanthes scabra]